MLKKAMISLIGFYKKNISPLLPPSCRYYPTCSEYAMQAIEKFGAVKGGLMGFCRVLRCNPFVKGGYDPVGDRFTLRRYGYEKKKTE